MCFMLRLMPGARMGFLSVRGDEHEHRTPLRLGSPGEIHVGSNQGLFVRDPLGRSVSGGIRRRRRVAIFTVR